MSTACRRLKSPPSLFDTSAHPTLVTLVNSMVLNGWLTSFSFYVNPPSNSWVHGCGQRARSAQYHINSLRFHLTSIRPIIPEIELFRNLTLKHPRSRLWVRSKVKVTYCTQYPTDEFPFRFTSIGPTYLTYGQNSVWPWKKHPNFKRKYAKIKVSNSTFPKSNQVITMTWAKPLPCFLVMRWEALTLSCRQANFCQSMPQLWPRVKVKERSSSTFPQTHIFFVPNI